MKIFLITLILFTSLCAVPAYAETDLKIAQIDMFPSGAKFIFELTPDAQKNFQAEIPGAFDADSIRLVNPNSARDFKALVKTRDDWTPESLKALKAQILSHEELIANLNSKKAALEQTKNLLSEAMPKEADANNLLNYIKEAENLKLRTETELAELKVKLDDANKTLKRLKNDFNLKAPANSNKFIELTGTAINNKNLLIEAFTNSARWYPEYTMQLDTSTGEIKTNMYVKLSQRTGLDYNGLIIFHTKYPDENVSTPRVNPLRVGFKPKEEPKLKARAMGTANYAMSAMRAPDMRRSEMMMMEDGAMDTEPEEFEEAAPLAPVMKATLADNSVQGSGLLTGDGSEAEFNLGEIKLTGKPELVLIPDQRNTAWILAKLDDITTPLIPGEAKLFVDGQPSGETDIPEYGIGRSKIAFGYAPQLSAKKEAMIEKTGSSWLSGGVFTSGYTIQVTNSMAEDKKVIIKDRLPIPTDEKIKLEVNKISPEPQERDKENRLTWELEVKSGETVKIIVDYKLTYPSGETLQYK
ncbi:MAG: mucoidy inhibitor MuiA family protein [Synergistaceae bacterium]|nr:mucoidy inhibitor MuiA family protein [Synergistaceae bacterium]